MDPVTIALLAGTAVKGISALVKGIKGRKMKKKGEKQMKKAVADIKYTRPEEYSQIQNLLGYRKTTVDTRREMAEERVRGRTAAGIEDIRQLADSPVAALGAYGGMKAREQESIAELAPVFENIRDEALMGEVAGLEMGAGYSEKEQYYNDMYKKMIKANLGASKMGAGQNMAWEGFEQLGSAALDFAGTKYLSNLYNPKMSVTPGDTSVNPVTAGMTDVFRPKYSPSPGVYDKIGQ